MYARFALTDFAEHDDLDLVGCVSMSGCEHKYWGIFRDQACVLLIVVYYFRETAESPSCFADQTCRFGRSLT
jgi:hypothetical protein